MASLMAYPTAHAARTIHHIGPLPAQAMAMVVNVVMAMLLPNCVQALSLFADDLIAFNFSYASASFRFPSNIQTSTPEAIRSIKTSPPIPFNKELAHFPSSAIRRTFFISSSLPAFTNALITDSLTLVIFFAENKVRIFSAVHAVLISVRKSSPKADIDLYVLESRLSRTSNGKSSAYLDRSFAAATLFALILLANHSNFAADLLILSISAESNFSLWS